MVDQKALWITFRTEQQELFAIYRDVGGLNLGVLELNIQNYLASMQCEIVTCYFFFKCSPA